MVGELIRQSDYEEHHLDRDYVFMTCDEFVKFVFDIFKNNPNSFSDIDFSFSTKESVFEDGEAIGWYGLSEMEIFDGYYIVMGFYGGMNAEVVPLDDFTELDIRKALMHLAAKDFEDGKMIAIDASTILG